MGGFYQVQLDRKEINLETIEEVRKWLTDQLRDEMLCVIEESIELCDECIIKTAEDDSQKACDDCFNDFLDVLIADDSIVDAIDGERLESLIEDWLDEGGTVDVAGCKFYPSHIISQCDPIRYQMIKDDYVNSELDI